MGPCPLPHVSVGFSFIISGSTGRSLPLLEAALDRVQAAYRPSTVASNVRYFRTFQAYIVFMDLSPTITVHNLLTFMEHLHLNTISPKVIKSYISSISAMAKCFRLDYSAVANHHVMKYLRSISINSKFAPTPRGLFDIKTMYHISISCDILTDPMLFRAIFLTAYFGFLRMSNMAPRSVKKFDPSKHFLRRDVQFLPPGVHLLIKWTKTLQDNNSHHVVQLPLLENMYLCLVRALQALLNSKDLPPSAPLFATIHYPHNQVIDTHVRDALKKILQLRNISPIGHGFHTFRRSGVICIRP